LELPVLALGFKEPGTKPSAILVLYFGIDAEAGAAAVNQAFAAGTIAAGYVLRGQQVFAGQLLHYVTESHRPAPAGELIPAGGVK
jgi:hypothetical protein